MGDVVAPRISVSAPISLELIGSLNWVGVGFRLGLGTKGLGTGLDNTDKKDLLCCHIW